AALGRYPSSATARMTASRLAALTLGELRSTSETSDLDTPARAATVSRVGFLAVRPGAATRPSSVVWSAPTLRGEAGGGNEGTGRRWGGGPVSTGGQSARPVQSRSTSSVCSPASGTPRTGPEAASLNR